MGFKLGHVPAHTGDSVAADPIRSIESIKQIKSNLYEIPRDYALFVLGINTAFRCGDLLDITVGDVRGKAVGEDIVIREEKTGKIRRCTLNTEAVFALKRFIKPSMQDHEFMFNGQRGQMTVSYANRLIKGWCKAVGLNGQFSSHTLRKTWAYHQRVTFKTPIEQIMLALNHSSQQQTLEYICIQSDEMKEVYANSL